MLRFVCRAACERDERALLLVAQTAAWEPPPWTETPQLPAGRHAIAERGDPPGWDLHQLLGQAQPADEQRAAERVDVKAHKAARAKV